MAKGVTGYSPAQMALHWMVVILVAFQFLAHDAIEASWNAYTHGEPSSESDRVLTYMHVGAGLLVLALMLFRIYLRLTRGVPAAPADEPRILQLISEAVHRLIYIVLLMLPLSGMVAWGLGVELAAEAHGYLEKLLLGLITAHIGGALFQHLIRRSDVMMRMFAAQKSP